MPTIGLAELADGAAFLTRRDRKYLVPSPAVRDVVAALPPACVLSIEGATSFHYESVYFDTPDLRSYSDSAKRRPRRFKVRTRTYTASDECMLEVKLRDGRGQTVKHRTSHPVDRRQELTPDAERFIGTIPEVATQVGMLTASLITTFRRSTFVLDDLKARVTVDVDLRWSTTDGEQLHLPEVAIFETKTSGRPSSYDQILWCMGFRPSTVSKYCTGLAALRPLLPANKWHRVLSRDLALPPGESGVRSDA